MDGSTYGYYFVRIHPLRRSLTKDLLYLFLDGRDTSRTSYKDYFVNLRGAEVGIFERLQAGSFTCLDQLVAELLELSTREGTNKVLGDTIYGHYVGKVDVRRGA